MTSGRMEMHQAVLPVTLRTSDQRDLTFDFVVDTGFTGFLTLPPAVVSAMQLPYLEETTANLADDSHVTIDVHAATILWHETAREVRVFATGRRPLLGTALLAGREFIAQFVIDGLVEVRDL